MIDKPETLRGSPTKELDELEHRKFSEVQRITLEGSVWRKLDIWVLPICTIFYLLSFLDRSNISNARVAGLQTSLKMTNYQFTMALTVTYIPYIVAEFPSNLLLKRVGPNRMLPAMITMWGLVTTLQGEHAVVTLNHNTDWDLGVVHNYSGLLACRFFLGLVEGGLFPGLVLYLSFFYPRKRLQIRVATFFASASLSGAFSGLLAAAIDKMNGKGGRPGWAWIFILEGIFTFFVGAISFFLLPRSPEQVRFFSEDERAYVMSVLKEDGAVSRDDRQDRFSWREVIESVKSLHVWFTAAVLFFNGVTLYSLAYFEPTIVADLGYAGNRAQLMSVPPFATAFVCSLISSFAADRYRCRGLTIIFFSILAVIGFSMFYASKSSNIRYGSLFFSITGSYCTAPPLATWMANNSAPHVRRASALAIAFIMTNVGGILATWLLGTLSPAPNYTAATITSIVMSICMAGFATINLAYLVRENRLKAKTRREMSSEEEPAGLGDRSAWFIYNL